MHCMQAASQHTYCLPHWGVLDWEDLYCQLLCYVADIHKLAMLCPTCVNKQIPFNMCRVAGSHGGIKQIFGGTDQDTCVHVRSDSGE